MPAPESRIARSSQKLTSTTVGATIYYTANGTTPTTDSMKYTAAITVSASETIKAIAVASGYQNSAIASANYTITSSEAAISKAALPHLHDYLSSSQI